MRESGNSKVPPLPGVAGLSGAAHFPAILGTGNYLGNIEVLDDAWYSLWSQHTLFSSVFFLPALLGSFCAWQWRLEHTDHNWNSFLTAPAAVRDLYGAKLSLSAVVSFLAQGCIGVLFLLSGKIAGISGPVPPELPGWLLCGALGGVSVCAVQLFFSLVIRAFAPPVAFGLVGGILGLMFTAQGWGYVFPYALLCLGMRANNPQMVLNFSSFALSVLVRMVVLVWISLRYLQRRDIAAEERQAPGFWPGACLIVFCPRNYGIPQDAGAAGQVLAAADGDFLALPILRRQARPDSGLQPLPLRLRRRGRVVTPDRRDRT